jgi:hypothetical protein
MRHREAGSWTVRSLTGLKSALIVASFMLFLSDNATSQGEREMQSARFEFALIGDMPYDARHEKEFANVMQDINAAELAFVVHNGDFWWDGAAWTEQAGGLAPCSDEIFQNRLGLAQRSRHPFIFVPGDNEWTDCHRAKPRTYDPLERLTKLRQMFFQGDQSLGQRTIRLTRQSEDSQYAKFRENVRWTHGEVLFVTLHVVGSNNNLGRCHGGTLALQSGDAAVFLCQPCDNLGCAFAVEGHGDDGVSRIGGKVAALAVMIDAIPVRRLGLSQLWLASVVLGSFLFLHTS